MLCSANAHWSAKNQFCELDNTTAQRTHHVRRTMTSATNFINNFCQVITEITSVVNCCDVGINLDGFAVKTLDLP